MSPVHAITVDDPLIPASELEEIAQQCFHAGNTAMVENMRQPAPYLITRERQLKLAAQIIRGLTRLSVVTDQGIQPLAPVEVRDEEEI